MNRAVRIKQLKIEVFREVLLLSRLCEAYGMRPAPAQVTPLLREILPKGEASMAELRLLARTDEQLYIWFRLGFLTEKARAGVQKLGEILDEARPGSARTVLHGSLLQPERKLEPGPTRPPEEQNQRGVEAESETDRASKRRVTELDVTGARQQESATWDTGPGNRTHEWNFDEGIELWRKKPGSDSREVSR